MPAAQDRTDGRATPGLRSAYAAFVTLPTRWSDNDIYGHMNNVIHYALIDSAVNGWLIENALLDIHGGDTIGLVVETGCRYFAELAFPDPVTAGIRAARIGNSSVRYEIGLFRGDADTAAAEGFFVHVYVDRATRRPTSLPATMRAKLSEIAR
ncbi:MAG: thioesterase family protein [Aurantimonas endophytica]|uniref:acyl-CoA thioesterase n=1 Tax=Aurantimonas endophytica TaxID=1522175 RepID=UPI003002B5D8